MWNFISSHRPSRSQDWAHFNIERNIEKPRGSIERQRIDPLMDECGTDERRYYRSAEFQQALLEAKIERDLASVESPIEDNKRQSWHRRSSTIGRMNTRASQSASSLPMFDYEADRIRQLEEARSEQPPPDVELPSPGGEAVAPPEHVPDLNRDESTDGSNSSEQSHQRRRSRPRINKDGLAPLFQRARNSFYGGKRD
ncbi:hypothetical protein CLAFUW4_11333 [Fulvia fulva]|uniref:Uncharacterized protein n=1 Tax=Passalora fulva TaxID=5499 RepID=A0A9Q8URC1_PASFU|nr:uncharacterized protein CLAFUR5_10374 [Fulvia fulva]KAK4620207.1 hypothetical protein CLAFUR4_11339 [Fulvia fulva]KAK4620373.1 hypothetical protein CLAFUR0_11345 [Fulvia fulva]UJO19557.1 hypothetical protein CLAFUR5_10374 [Fulvia fulva]WPV16972.1 hypothetical protein CLAFUW4_11333 [Fulvia fulva]WPV32260.1 hypothetical protein CLAFUW7_11329 [Fulvia fulva]